MQQSNNLCLRNQQSPPHLPQLCCPNQQCTQTFTTTTSMTLHVRQGNHSLIDETIPSSPMTPNSQAELKPSRPPPPVHPFSPLFEDLEEEIVPPQPSLPSSFSSPINVDTSSASGSVRNATDTHSMSPHQMEVDNLEEEGASVTSGAHDDHGTLFEGESSSEGECDDAGVPMT